MLKSKKIAIVKEKRANNAYVCDVINRGYVDTFFDSKTTKYWCFRKKIKGMLVEYDDFEKKLVCLTYERGYRVLPMLHGMERW